MTLRRCRKTHDRAATEPRRLPPEAPQGIEHEDPNWALLAVQWHPEYLGHNNDVASRALFDALIETARVEATV